MLKAQMVAVRELLTPLPGSRAETKADMGDVVFVAPLRKLTTMVFLPNDCLLCGERTRQWPST